ncbi:hypothetical protein EGM70_01925 [Enterobacteriaceae bacterium 89]|nr:hypothetical protein [Enterobacteriaceae bacterium 89]
MLRKVSSPRFRFFSADSRDIHHAYPALNPYSAKLCGTDHSCRSPFHFEVENNSLQTGNPAR